MESITLNKIKKNNCTIEFNFKVSQGLEQYFSGKKFFIEYPENIEKVPDAVAAVPFVCNVLPIIWLTDSKLIIDELDMNFYNSIPDIKKGYETMFPDVKFLGEVCADSVIKCNKCNKTDNKCAMFYSGGLDSAHTLVRHYDEKPVLLSIWGSDIKFDNSTGWKIVDDVITETAKNFDLEKAIFHSTFREFDNEGGLDKEFSSQLGDGWWHGVKHGIGLLGHVAPYAYIHKINTMYIASTYSMKYNLVKCASSPLIDNYVKFCNCQVIHDGYECSRQDKAHDLVNFGREQDLKIKLHVCWESQNGSNCCRCEKCYRTIANLWVEGGDPNEYGFDLSHDKLNNMKFIVFSKIDFAFKDLWKPIQEKAIKNKKMLKRTRYYKDFKWIYKIDFKNYRNNKCTINYGLRYKLSQYKFYQKLSIFKHKLIK